MKKLLLILFILPCFLFGQDILMDKNGNEIEVKIIEVGIDKIRYNKYDNISGPIYTAKKRDYLKINYENGTEDVFDADRLKKLQQNPEKKSTKLNRKGYLTFKALPAIAINNSNLVTGPFSSSALSFNYNISYKQDVLDFLSINAGFNIINDKHKVDKDALTFGDQIDPAFGFMTESDLDDLCLKRTYLGFYLGTSLKAHPRHFVNTSLHWVYDIKKAYNSLDLVYHPKVSYIGVVLGWDYNVINNEKFLFFLNSSCMFINRPKDYINLGIGMGFSYLIKKAP